MDIVPVKRDKPFRGYGGEPGSVIKKSKTVSFYGCESAKVSEGRDICPVNSVRSYRGHGWEPEIIIKKSKPVILYDGKYGKVADGKDTINVRVNFDKLEEMIGEADELNLQIKINDKKKKKKGRKQNISISITSKEEFHLKNFNYLR